MKRASTQTESRVYAYCAATPLSGKEYIEAEAERCRSLWNQLVAIERAHDAAILHAAAVSIPELAQAEIELSAISQALQQIHPRDEIRRLLRQRQTVERSTWAPLTAWRKIHPEVVCEIETARRRQVVSARQASGLYWGNYNAIIEDYESARRTVRQFGRHLRMIREHPGRGYLTVQIQRTRSGLGAAPGELLDGSFAQLQIGIINPLACDPHTFRGKRRQLCRTTCDIRVDAEGHLARLPLVMHRRLPEGWRVKSAQLVWKDRAWQLCLTITRPAQAMQIGNRPHKSIRLGWEALTNELRIAPGLCLPARWMSGMDRVQLLHGAINQHFDLINSWLVDSTIEPQRSAMQLADLVRHRRLNGLQIPTKVIAWYRLHERWQQEMMGLRKRLLGRRRELYRLYAINAVQDCGRLTVETPLLAVIAQSERDSPDNALRQRAALHTLVSILQHMGRKANVAVEIASAPMMQEIDPSKIRHISRRQRTQLESARMTHGLPYPDQGVT